MPLIDSQLRPLRQGLLGAGFQANQLVSLEKIPFPDGSVRAGLLAFSDAPFDSRTAAILALVQPRITESEVSAARPLGAPIVFACANDQYQLWKQGTDRARFVCALSARELPAFFDKHAAELTPDAIYRAKTWALLEHDYQLDFVDVGLLPVVEADAGAKLRALIERVVQSTSEDLKSTKVSETDGPWLLKATFWLLAAKILKDKAVPGFGRLALTDLDSVYQRLAKHYNSDNPKPVVVRNRSRREALEKAAREIQTFGHCGLVTTEALAHLYESALIDRATRRRLGTHSTPQWLVQYIVGRLRPWISEMQTDMRSVFEPACGHAGFLIAAMRLLSELLPRDWHQSRQAYLRRRLHGLEHDSFAVEIARLSLTLADAPHPNGWMLTEANMFSDERMDRSIQGASIVLGNPPFEDFEHKDRRSDWLSNKAAETFRRVVDNLSEGSVFGFVLPQTLLHSSTASSVRKLLARDYEIDEISLFADKVFKFGDPECAVLIGRRVGRQALHCSTRYRRIREKDTAAFSRTYEPSSEMAIDSERWARAPKFSFLVPEFDDVWQELRNMKQLQHFAEVGQGFSHKSTSKTVQSTKPLEGFVRGFAKWSREVQSHQLPPLRWLSLDPKLIDRPRHGVRAGVAQIVLNYAPTSRGPWRIRALIDEEGRPATSRFNVVRPYKHGPSLLALWAVYNSPIANAYIYSHSSKRDLVTRVLRNMPVPDFSAVDLGPLEAAATRYLGAVRAQKLTTQQRPHRRATSVQHFDAPQINLFKSSDNSLSDLAADDDLKVLHWRMDSEVLRLYNLAAESERKVLDLFSGEKRGGVPFAQTEYFPRRYNELNRLADLLAITADWDQTNRRRGELLDLEDDNRLSAAETEELARLQRLADALLGLLEPWKADSVDLAVEQAKRRGVWKE